MKFFIKVSLFLNLILFTPILFAWNAFAHTVIANIAYENLKPDTKEKVDKFVGYFHNEYPNINSFAELAPWPDAIRGQKIETFTHWHYIDNAISDDHSPLKNLIDTDNAVWALKAIIQIVKNQKANSYERARFLAFLTHIVGDLHQPLHTVSRISAEHADGDRGGNLFYVHYNNNRVNLHYLWDNGVGLFDGKNVQEFTKNLTTLYPKYYFDKKATDLTPEDWVKEGVANAKEYVYATPEGKNVSSEYVKKGQEIVSQELALAGYRLAGILNNLLG